jgi:lipoate---protein ligase
MKYLDLTFASPEENLACDEALVETCENGCDDEILRFWEPQNYFVVLGYANKAETEVNLDACRARKIPVLRRSTGGGTVVQGKGCLNYALVLDIRKSPQLASITGTNAFIMETHKRALDSVLREKLQVQGHTDLTIEQLKFSGNAQRRRREFLIFHGTFLLAFDLNLIEELLPIPAKQPLYRENRSHRKFLANLNVPAEEVKRALGSAWNAAGPLGRIPSETINRLVQEKYSRDEWNFRF